MGVFRLLTNNPKVYESFQSLLVSQYEDSSFLEILKMARDAIHQGARLESHPLSGSLKPGETPYKSVLLMEGEGANLDLDSLHIIEEAIRMSEVQMASHRKAETLSDQVHEDFQVVDLCLIRSALESAGIA